MNLNSFSICTEKEESHINGLRRPERHSPARVSKLFVKGQRINVLDFVGQVVSATTVELCHCSKKVVRDRTQDVSK